MTPIQVRRAAFDLERKDALISPHEAFLQGYLFALSYHNIEDKTSALNDRKQKFGESLIPYVEEYGKELIRSFFDYWSEYNRSQTKMRYELEKTWELTRRLAYWKRRTNERTFNNGNNTTTQQRFASYTQAINDISREG